jgi:hypothetical protein
MMNAERHSVAVMGDNSQFIRSCRFILSSGGVYGEVGLYKDKKGKIMVKKKCQQVDIMTLACLTKEAFFLRYLSQDNSFVPCLTAWRKSELTGLNKSEKTLMNESEMKGGCFFDAIMMHFVGPSLYQCNVMGFCIDPVWLLTQLMQACQFLEEKGVLHLDLKSDNVTYDLDERKIKLIDFGLSELCVFQDMEKEGGLVKVFQGKRTEAGRVSADGFLSNYLPTGSVFLQNQLLRRAPGVSRIKSHTNAPQFRPPETLVCQWFGIESGLEVDARFDVFSAAWIVVNHLTGADLDTGKYESCRKRERERLGRILFELLPNLVLLRGGCSREDIYSFVSAIIHAMTSLGMQFDSQEKWIGQLKAVESVLKCDPKEGCIEQMQYLYGEGFVQAIKSALHPVAKFRSSAGDVIQTLLHEEEDEDENLNMEECDNVRYTSFVLQERYVVCLAMKEDFRIASITVDCKSQRILWHFLSALERLKSKSKVWCEMLQLLHRHACCHDNCHAEQWYDKLDESKRLNK